MYEGIYAKRSSMVVTWKLKFFEDFHSILHHHISGSDPQVISYTQTDGRSDFAKI